MAVGNYLGTKSELEYIEAERRVEEWEVTHIPEEEAKEIRRIYQHKGFSGRLLDQIVSVITKNKKQWVDEMMIHELGLLPDTSTSPLKNAIATFISFAIAGLLPLLPFVLGFAFPLLAPSSFTMSIQATALSLFIIGSLRTRITKQSWLRSGLEMLAVGAIAASVAYFSGFLIKGLLDGGLGL